MKGPVGVFAWVFPPGRAGKDQEPFSLPKKRAFQGHIHGNRLSETQQSNAALWECSGFPTHVTFFKLTLNIHTIILKIVQTLVNVEDTTKNRERLGGRMRTVNPNRPECDEQTKNEILHEIDNRSAFLRSEQDARRNTDRLVLDEIIAKVKNAVLNADPPNFNVRDLIGFK